MIAPAAVGRKRLLGGGSGWYIALVTFMIELEREADGRWLAEVPDLPGVMCYGADRDEAVARVQALALRVIAERLEHREAHRSSSTSRSRRREHLAVCKGAPRSGRPSSYRLANQTNIRVASDPQP